MWVEELPNGKYKFCERYEDPLTGKLRKVSLTNIKNTKAVREEMLLKLQEKIKKKINEPQKIEQINFKELSDKWLIKYEPTVRPGTFYKTSKRLGKICRSIGHIQLDRLKAIHINDFLFNQLTEEKLTYNTVRMNKSLIINVLKFGLPYGYFKEPSIILSINIPKINLNPDHDDKYLEIDEVNKIIDHLKEINKLEQARMVQIMVNTGMRYGEMVSVNYQKNIDFSNCSIYIERTYDYENKAFGPPKTGENRTVYFNDDLIPILKQQIQCDQLKMIQHGLNREDPILFRSEFDNPHNRRFLNDQLALIEINNKKITSHIFRHTFITIAIENKIDKEVIAEQVGHADTKMIDKVYKHINDNMKQEHKNVMGNFKVI